MNMLPYSVCSAAIDYARKVLGRSNCPHLNHKTFGAPYLLRKAWQIDMNDQGPAEPLVMDVYLWFRVRERSRQLFLDECCCRSWHSSPGETRKPWPMVLPRLCSQIFPHTSCFCNAPAAWPSGMQSLIALQSWQRHLPLICTVLRTPQL